MNSPPKKVFFALVTLMLPFLLFWLWPSASVPLDEGEKTQQPALPRERQSNPDKTEKIVSVKPLGEGGPLEPEKTDAAKSVSIELEYPEEILSTEKRVDITLYELSASDLAATPREDLSDHGIEKFRRKLYHEQGIRPRVSKLERRDEGRYALQLQLKPATTALFVKLIPRRDESRTYPIDFVVDTGGAPLWKFGNATAMRAICEVEQNTKQILFQVKRPARLSASVFFEGEPLARRSYEVAYRYSQTRWEKIDTPTAQELGNDLTKLSLSSLPVERDFQVAINIKGNDGFHFGQDMRLAMPYYFEFNVAALDPAESRESVRFDLPPLPYLEIEVPPTEEFRGNKWKILAFDVFQTDTGINRRYGRHFGEFRHAPSVATLFRGSAYGHHMAWYSKALRESYRKNIVDRPRPFHSRPPFSAFLATIPKKRIQKRIEVLFLGAGFDPVSFYYDIEFDWEKGGPTRVQINPQPNSLDLRLEFRSFFDDSLIPNAKVIVGDVDADTTTWRVTKKTDAHGRASFVAPASNIRIRAWAEGFAPLVHRIDGSRPDKLPVLLTLRMFPRPSGTLSLDVFKENGERWQGSDGSIWAMVVPEEPDPRRIIHKTWVAELEAVDEEGQMHFKDVPPGKYLVTLLAHNRRPWTSTLDVSAKEDTEYELRVDLVRLREERARLDLSSVKQSIASASGMNLGFRRNFALIQGNFGVFTKRIVNILRGEIVWLPGESDALFPKPFLPTQLLGQDPTDVVEVGIDPTQPLWLIGPSGAIVPIVKDGNSLKPDDQKLATVRGQVTGVKNFEGLIIRAVPISKRMGERSPYNVLSGVSVAVDKSGSFVITHLMPATYRLLLLKPGDDGTRPHRVSNRKSNTILTLSRREDRTVLVEADE